MCVLLITRRLWLVGRLDSRNRLKHQLVDVTQIHRPKSVRNYCVIEDFFGIVTLLFRFFRECWGFFHGTESYLFLFLLVRSMVDPGF